MAPKFLLHSRMGRNKAKGRDKSLPTAVLGPSPFSPLAWPREHLAFPPASKVRGLDANQLNHLPPSSTQHFHSHQPRPFQESQVRQVA